MDTSLQYAGSSSGMSRSDVARVRAGDASNRVKISETRNAMHRTYILTMVAVISTILSTFFLFLVLFSSYFGAVVIADFSVNSVCVILMFGYSKKWYEKICHLFISYFEKKWERKRLARVQMEKSLQMSRTGS